MSKVEQTAENTVTEDQLFQNFSKQVTALQQNFNLLFDGSKALAIELQKAKNEIAQLKGTAPKTIIAKPPNRKERRMIEKAVKKEEKKQAKKVIK